MGPDSPRYGQWIVRHVDMSFEPKPKRERLMADGKRLEVRRFPLELESVPYKKVLDREAQLIKLAQQEAEEQPDTDLIEYDVEEGGV